MITPSQLAERLGCHVRDFHYHQRRGTLPRPSICKGWYRYFTDSEADQIEAFWKTRRRSSWSHFSKADVVEMERLWNLGHVQAEIARRFKTTQPTVSRLLNRVTKKVRG